MHVQLAPGAKRRCGFRATACDAALGIEALAGQVVVSQYEAFPYGMGLDYERKFAYYVPGEALALV